MTNSTNNAATETAKNLNIETISVVWGRDAEGYGTFTITLPDNTVKTSRSFVGMNRIVNNYINRRRNNADNVDGAVTTYDMPAIYHEKLDN